jgi:hypothetical protein
MQSHSDNLHNKFIELVRERAVSARNNSQSLIASGKDGEIELKSWESTNGFNCRQLPSDPQGILRLSIGGGDDLPVQMDYLSIRGDKRQCVRLLKRALKALEECPE